MTKYYLSRPSWGEEEREVTREEYILAERNAGFHPKSGNPDDLATGSFSGGNGYCGRVDYSKADVEVDEIFNHERQNPVTMRAVCAICGDNCSHPTTHPMKAVPVIPQLTPELKAAIATLKHLRYTWTGGEQWRPPRGLPPESITGIDYKKLVENIAYIMHGSVNYINFLEWSIRCLKSLSNPEIEVNERQAFDAWMALDYSPDRSGATTKADEKAFLSILFHVWEARANLGKSLIVGVKHGD